MMTSLFSENKDHGNQATTEVEQARLDDLVESAGPVSLVKLDVEGAELLALAGMHTILDRNSEIMVVAEYGPFYIRRAGIDIDDWFAKFAELGLTSIYQIDEETGLCRKGRPSAEPVDFPSINVLFSRPGNPRLASLQLVGEHAPSWHGGLSQVSYYRRREFHLIGSKFFRIAPRAPFIAVVEVLGSPTA